MPSVLPVLIKHTMTVGAWEFKIGPRTHSAFCCSTRADSMLPKGAPCDAGLIGNVRRFVAYSDWVQAQVQPPELAELA